MGKNKKTGKGLDAVVTNGNDNGLDLRNYVFYSDPLSRDNLNSRSPHNKKNHHGSVESADSSSSSSKRTSSASIGRTSSPSAPLVAGKNNTHKNNADYAAVIEEGGIESSHHHHPTIRPESSYYTRMALEEAEAKESMPSVLHNPKIRIQLASMKHHRPWFLGIMTIIQVACLIGSCVINWKTTGSPIQLVPFNYMIGPGSGVLITMGARWVPCMRSGTGLENYPSIECPVGIQGSVASANNNDPATCTLSDICGFGGVDNAHPNQWYRFLTAMGLHGGLLHLLFNLSFQVRTGFQMEKDFGWWRIAMIYFLSGIAGFVFGANFNPMTPSVGCSGALYGLMACLLLDLFQNWRLINKPWLELFKMGIQILISLLIGMLPFIDNFAHIGGFYTGILAGLLFMPTIHFGTWDKWRKRVLMLGALPALVVILVFLFKGFYGSAPECTWCKYLNCIPGLPWCEDKWNTAAITAAPQR
ncbi:rhomboid family-domain-containing protein [Powellomyces hirtus]|nr:rhomboid family-domain-containing protein [Powellomyces hirtus]